MFSKALLVSSCLFVAALAVEIQVCQNGEGTGDKMEVDYDNCTMIKVGDDSLYFDISYAGGNASNGTLTGLYSTFNDAMCSGTPLNSSVTMTCNCDESGDIHFVCEGSAIIYPSVVLLVTALALIF